jgi:hypothetical protein
VEAVEVLKRVVLAAFGGGDRERHQRREPPGLAQIGQLAAALPLRRDHQDTQPRRRERIKSAEPVGEHPQLAEPFERGDQAFDRRFDRRHPQPLQVGTR